GLLLVPPAAMARQPRHSEDWKALVTYLGATIRPGDCVLIDTDHGQRLIDYYRFERPACYFRSIEAATGQIGAARFVAVEDSSDMEAIRQAFPGAWSAELHFGPGLTLGVREPSP